MKIFLSLLIVLLLQPFIAGAQPKYEFRGVWIASVANIDWPSSEGLSTSQQKQEFINMLDRLQRIGINAVIVQIRPAADALYASSFEPWSEYLTGKQGQAPSPYYDPLQFMINETHKRGMEFHAWINPYRAVQNPNASIAPNHITRQHPEWFLKYGDKKYFNPGLPQVMNYLTDVVKDIITRYDIDAIHMDDYFYPYRIPGKEFPDYQSYILYGDGLSRAAWRRANCDSIVKRIHDLILDYKPLIKFGISPFGVWRNSNIDSLGSNTQAGQTCYDDLYADVLLWLKEGWIDYVVPQLYWEIGHKLCDFETLVDWWGDNSYGKQLYIGQGIYRAIEKPTPAWRNPNEIPDEIRYLRNNKNVQGSAFFSSNFLLYNPNGWADSLRLNFYNTPALIPPMKWIDTIAPIHPHIAGIKADNASQSLRITGDGINNNETETIRNFVLYFSNSLNNITDHPSAILPSGVDLKFDFNIQTSLIPADWNICYVVVTSVDKENNESAPSNIFTLERTSNGWVVKK
ncbi:MAG: family 10 glycosylhydrolase [Bacteroidetes bacterium]|nr:family 10 glycosylhydrolase [Bacteroidota bacterium]